MIKLFEITEEAYNQYRSSVNGRRSVEKEYARLLLTRNIILSVAFPHKKYIHYYYGRLRITVNNDNVIIGIKNHTNNKTEIDKYKKRILNEVLNII